MINVHELIKRIESVLDTTGIYPKAVQGGDKPYKERDERMNGWNDAVIEITKRISKILSEVENEYDKDLTLLLLADVMWEDHGHYILDMNDTFYYASADGEEVRKDEIGEVARLFRFYGYDGVNYWVAGKRGHDPDIPDNKKGVEWVRSCEKKREAERKRRYAMREGTYEAPAVSLWKKIKKALGIK